LTIPPSSVAFNQENILWLRRFRGPEYSSATSKVEGPHPMMKEDRPTCRADQRREGRAAAVQQLIRLELAVAHCVYHATAIELMPSLPQSKHRRVLQLEVIWPVAGSKLSRWITALFSFSTVTVRGSPLTTICRFPH
jgi:hypothetical protein